MRKKALILMVLLPCLFISVAQTKQRFHPQSLEMEWKLVKDQTKKDPGFICGIKFTNKDKENLPVSGWKIYFNLRYHGYRLKSLSNEFEIRHISGELFCIMPSLEFKGLSSGQSINMEYTGAARIANYQDIPSGLFWVNDNKPDSAIAMNKLLASEENDPATPTGRLSFTDASKVFDKNDGIINIALDQLPKIFPTPFEYHVSAGNFLLNENTSIIAEDDFMNEAGYLADAIQKLIGKRPGINGLKKSDNIIVLKKDQSAAEAYKLVINPETINISASDGAGIFYGIQSLKSLLPVNAWALTHASLEIPCMDINDEPRFAVREFMLDVSRNFQPKEEILRTLELMSIYKLNTFHFHLTDDEGWRLEIPGLPELTGIGAKRGYPFNDNHQLHPSYGSGPGNNSSGTGYYSKEDFVEILRYATQRHILVIPEIESPGHARAAVKAMSERYKKYMKAGNKTEAEKYLLGDPKDKSSYMSNQYFNDNVMDAALPSTYTFMEKVIDEIKSMYTIAHAPLIMIHVGGDEVPDGSWEKSPAAMELMQKNKLISNTKELWVYYFGQIKNILKTRDISMTGWEELATGTQHADHSRKVIVNPDFIRDHLQLEAWIAMSEGDDVAYELANAGYKVVLCFVDYFYLDLAYRKSFSEPGDAWVGYLDLQKVFSFNPYNFYKNTKDDIEGNPLPENWFASKKGLTETGKQNIRGIQAAMWQENITSPTLFEYMLLPRLLAMAERAWTKEPAWAIEHDDMKAKELFKKDWSAFVNIVSKKELPRLDFYNGGYQYRIPTASAIIRDGKVIVNTELPGFVIRYTIDGSVPTSKSAEYINPIPAKGIIHLSVFNSRGRSGKMISIENK